MAERQPLSPSQAPAQDTQWMIRTAQNRINGPYSIEEIRTFIKDGNLTTLDEVCPSEGFWFFLHEAVEVEKLLGVSPPVPLHGAEDEVTQTEVVASGTATATKGRPSESLTDSDDVDTGVFVQGGIRRSSTGDHIAPNKTPYPESSASASLEQALNRTRDNDPGISWLQRVELVSFWKILTVFITGLGMVVFLAILRLIRHTH